MGATRAKSPSRIKNTFPGAEVDQNTSEWSIQNRRVCFECSRPVPDENDEICPYCGSQDIDERHARPSKTEPIVIPTAPFPWNHQALRHGCTLILTGGPGSGKTSSCIKLDPKLYVTTEQEIQEVAHAWYRLMPHRPAPLISNVYAPHELYEDLAFLEAGEIGVVDSISQFSDGPEASKIMKKVIEETRRKGAILIFIAQFTKAGDMKGPNMLNHMVDAIVEIPDDPLGMRQLTAKKNRFGDLWSQYFTFTKHGELVEQPFDYAYTVEGSAGNYRLHLFPMSGAKLDGILKELAENNILIEGMASAAVKSRGYQHGFAEPPDSDRRKEFAIRHGLQWVGPEEACELLKQNLMGEAK